MQQPTTRLIDSLSEGNIEADIVRDRPGTYSVIFTTRWRDEEGYNHEDSSITSDDLLTLASFALSVHARIAKHRDEIGGAA